MPTDDEYFAMYVDKAADPGDLLALGHDLLAQQIRELNPDEADPDAAADAILRVAREWLAHREDQDA